MEAERRHVRLPVPVVLDDGPDGGSVLKASPSWRAHAATTRLTKKDFMASAGMKIMDDVGATKIMLMRCPVDYNICCPPMPPPVCVNSQLLQYLLQLQNLNESVGRM